jgi:hypothetical protein
VHRRVDFLTYVGCEMRTKKTYSTTFSHEPEGSQVIAMIEHTFFEMRSHVWYSLLAL